MFVTISGLEGPSNQTLEKLRKPNLAILHGAIRTAVLSEFVQSARDEDKWREHVWVMVLP